MGWEHGTTSEICVNNPSLPRGHQQLLETALRRALGVLTSAGSMKKD